ncbi:MAG: hypothetical protein RLO01_13050 [Thalassobaculaceae bacterium]
MHHTARFLSSSEKASGWIAEKRELVGAIDAELRDPRGDALTVSTLLDRATTRRRRTWRDAGPDGIVFPSVRQLG